MSTQSEFMNTIFKNGRLHICISPQNNIKLDAKCVHVFITAFNQVDGKVYTKYAGWLSRTMAIHGGSKTPGYIYDAAIDEIVKHNDSIYAALIAAGKVMDSNNAGSGVTYSVAHPSGNSEVNNVRRMMQLNAPVGTRH